jgi:hypothetical protein
MLKRIKFCMHPGFTYLGTSFFYRRVNRPREPVNVFLVARSRPSFFSLRPHTELPYNDYFEYFGPDFKLHISPSNMTNQNTNEYLEKIK